MNKQNSPASDELKSQFLNIIFGQINTHVDIILHQCQNLLASKIPLYSKMQASHVRVIYRNTKRLPSVIKEPLMALLVDTIDKRFPNVADPIEKQRIFYECNKLIPTPIFVDTRPILMAIRGFSEVLLKGDEYRLPIGNESQKAQVISIKEHGRKIAYILDCILEFWRIEGYNTNYKTLSDRKYEFQLFDLKTSLTELLFFKERWVVGDLEPIIQTPDGELLIWADEAAILTLINVAASAASENFEKGQIIIEAEQWGNRTILKVKNDGYRLMTESLEEFQRIISTNTLFECRRLDVSSDLAMCWFLVEIHSGIMEVKNQEGMGR
jgi:hypothetical protein